MEQSHMEPRRALVSADPKGLGAGARAGGPDTFYTLTLSQIQSTENERSVVMWHVAGLGTFQHFWKL